MKIKISFARYNRGGLGAKWFADDGQEVLGFRVCYFNRVQGLPFSFGILSPERIDKMVLSLHNQKREMVKFITTWGWVYF